MSRFLSLLFLPLFAFVSLPSEAAVYLSCQSHLLPPIHRGRIAELGAGFLVQEVRGSSGTSSYVYLYDVPRQAIARYADGPKIMVVFEFSVPSSFPTTSLSGFRLDGNFLRFQHNTSDTLRFDDPRLTGALNRKPGVSPGLSPQLRAPQSRDVITATIIFQPLPGPNMSRGGGSF